MRRLVVALILGAFASCSTIGSLRPGAGGATFEVHGRTYDEVWKAAVRVMSNGLTLVESDRDSGVVKSEARAGLTTWGEVVGVFIEPTVPDAETYTVEVQSLKRSQVQITGQDWEPHVIAGIKAELGI